MTKTVAIVVLSRKFRHVGDDAIAHNYRWCFCFEFELLGFIWDLGFGAWNFHVFH